MDDLDAAVVVGLLVHEAVDGLELLLVAANQQVGAGQGVVALGADGDDGVAALLLGAHEVAHRRDVVDEVVLGEGEHRAAAVPSFELGELDTEQVEGFDRGQLEGGRPRFHRATRVVRDLHRHLTPSACGRR